LEIGSTETTFVSSKSGENIDQNLKAEKMGELAKLFFDRGHSFIVFGLSDALSNDYPAGMILDKQYQPLPAFYEIYEVLQEGL